MMVVVTNQHEKVVAWRMMTSLPGYFYQPEEQWAEMVFVELCNKPEQQIDQDHVTNWITKTQLMSVKMLALKLMSFGIRNYHNFH